MRIGHSQRSVERLFLRFDIDWVQVIAVLGGIIAIAALFPAPGPRQSVAAPAILATVYVTAWSYPWIARNLRRRPLALSVGEKILLRVKAETAGRTWCRYGYLYLTDARLAFVDRRGTVSLAYSEVVDVMATFRLFGKISAIVVHTTDSPWTIRVRRPRTIRAHVLQCVGRS